MGIAEDVERRLGQAAAQKGIAGAALGVLDRDERWVATTGVLDVRAASAIQPGTRFEIASVVKPMVATAVMRLAAAGRLGLDDPIVGYLPEVRGADFQEATVRQLLGNVAGVPLRISREFEFATADPQPLRAFVQDLARDGSLAPPGRLWSYSNAGWVVLGRALEVVTGSPFRDAMRELVWEPLAMRSTGLSDDGLAVPTAAGHEATADGPRASEVTWTLPALAPAGSMIVSTAEDLLRFAEVHVHGGGQLLDPSFIRAMREPARKLRIPDWIDGAWCHGWARYDWSGGTVWGWNGVSATQRTVLLIIPGRGALAFLSNTDRGRELFREVAPELLERRFGIRMPAFPAPPTAQPVDLSLYEGTYAWPESRWTARVVNGSLELESTTRQETYRARPIDRGTFFVRPGHADVPVVTFGEFDADGRPAVIYEFVWAYPRVSD